MINIKRWTYNKEYNVIVDNYDYEYTLAEYEPKGYQGAKYENMEELCEKMNQIQLEKEKAEAQLRALKL